MVGTPRGSQSDWSENLAEAEEARRGIQVAITKDGKTRPSRGKSASNRDLTQMEYLAESPLSYLDIFEMKEKEPIAHFTSGHHWVTDVKANASITSYRACGALKDEYIGGSLEMWLVLQQVGKSVLA